MYSHFTGGPKGTLIEEVFDELERGCMSPLEVRYPGLVEKNPAKKSRPKKAKKIHPKFHLSGWLFLAFIEKCVFY